MSRRLWPHFVAVAVIGVFAGVGIAGRPRTPNQLVVRPLPSEPSTTPVSTPRTTTTTTTTSTTPATTPATAPEPTAPVRSAVSAPGPVVDPTSALETVPRTEPLPTRSSIRLIIANGAGISGLAASTVARLAQQGWTNSTATDTLRSVAATTIYVSARFVDQGRQVAVDLGLPNAPVLPNNGAPITSIDAQGDIIVALGKDMPT